ncbi:MAG: dTMP kinase [Pseudomonadota bacterium]
MTEVETAAATGTASGLFVTFEGGDGTGKTTQLRRLAARLRAAGRAVVETREPGGAPGAEEIRRLVLEGEPGRWSAVTELLLFNAARRDHLERVIAPALAQGKVVLCDRFADSTRVYQGASRDAADAADAAAPEGDAAAPPAPSRALVDALHALVIGREPDLTLVLDADPVRALARGIDRGGPELRFERMGLPFHQAVRARFRALVEASPERCRLIDASGAPDEVERRVREAMAQRLPEVL